MKLIKRHKGNATTYENPDGSRVLQIGGTDNHLPFDGGNEYLPTHLIHSEAEDIGGGFVRHHNGPTRIDVSLNTGKIRYYPLRGEPNKYIEIKDPVPPTPFLVNQISDDTVEYYTSYPGWRLSFILNDRGVKTLITVDDSYTGDGEFELGFRLVGLTQDGRNIKDGDTIVSTMPDAFLYDAAETVRDVSETYDSASVVISADLMGLTHPIVIDPSIGPDADVWATYGQENTPTTNKSAVARVNLGQNLTNSHLIPWLMWDVSALPATGVNVSSAIAILYPATGASDWANYDYRMYRMLRHDAVEAEATFNIYKTGSNWTTPGGMGAGDVDTGNSVTTSAPTLMEPWIWSNLAAMVQDSYDAVANTKFAVNMHYTVFPGYATAGFIGVSTHRNVVAERPTLSITYWTGNDALMGGGLSRNDSAMFLASGGSSEF